MNEFQVAFFCLMRAFGVPFRTAYTKTKNTDVSSQEKLTYFAGVFFDSHIHGWTDVFCAQVVR